MNTATRLTAALACAGALATTLPAQATQVTWYVTGHMNAALPGTPADLMALAPEGAVYFASFSFDSASASSPLYFTSTRTDFRTTNALGATSMDVNGAHFSSSGSSTIIEQADFNGESVTLNGGAVSGPAPADYSLAALDVLNISHRGPGTDPASAKYPWFSPFGAGGTFVMISSAAPPDLSLSDAPGTTDLFFFSSATETYYHRIGTIEAISTTPFPVPEPSSAALMLAGAAAVLQLVRRRRADASSPA
jgi:hypothetical protein